MDWKKFVLRKSNFIFSDGLSRSLTIQPLTNVYDRDGKKLRGFAYRNHIMVDYRHKRDGVYEIYNHVTKSMHDDVINKLN